MARQRAKPKQTTRKKSAAAEEDAACGGRRRLRSPPPASPYGGGGGQGVSLPPYFQPTPYLNSNSTFFPTSEEIGPDEMRITFMGSCPFPPKRDQAATCICVELGNGDRFFFDFGPGCLRNILAAQVPLQTSTTSSSPTSTSTTTASCPTSSASPPGRGGGLRSACTGPRAARRTKASGT